MSTAIRIYLGRAALLGLVTALGALAWTGAAAAARPAAWPPAKGPGQLFAHYGEEHLTDPDGARLLPAVIADVIRYRPVAVMASADKTDNGTKANFNAYKAVIAAYDRAGIPFFGAMGNHDRTAPPGLPGGLPGSLASDVYRQAFAGRPYPWGDAQPVQAPGFAPAARPAGEQPGASTRYYVDIGPTRWVFMDNSCYSLSLCDLFQAPAFPDARDSGQFAWLARLAGEARLQGHRTFVVMHMPTQDNRPGHTKPTSQPHTMGEGTSADNGQFEALAGRLGVAGVFMGHIKAESQYRAAGVPYFMDGGAGGALYVGPNEQVGVDSGYWYGYRLVRVTPAGITTDLVPLVAPDGITVSGPGRLRAGGRTQFSATAQQPAKAGVPVPALALRDPDPARPNAAVLPAPARIWTTDDPLVLAPVAAPRDDPRRNTATQTRDGVFAARCPGRTGVTVTTGWASRSKAVTVPGRRGRVVRSIRRRARTVRRGRVSTVARLRLAQRARVFATVRRRGRVVATLVRRCASARRPLSIRWNGRTARGARARRGRYLLVVRVAGERRASVRRWRLRVR